MEAGDFESEYGPSANPNTTLEDVQKLGWGVTLTLSGSLHGQSRSEPLVLKDQDMVTFKESKWIGSWCGYFYTSIEHAGKHVTGYKLDIATEPTDEFAGPRAHKYFGLLEGVLGYHFDPNGTPPSADPGSDQILQEMGWGKPSAPQTPAAAPSPAADVVMTDVKKELPEEPPLAGPVTSPPTATPRLTAEHLKLLDKQQANPPTACGKPDKSMTRRAAYNLLNRIKNNPTRLNLLDPKVREKLLTSDSETAVPPDLVTQLVNAGGDLEQLNAVFSVSHEKEQYELDNSKLKPHTEMMIFAKYGEADGKAVMELKRQQGLVKDDPNCPGKKVYLLLDETRFHPHLQVNWNSRVYGHFACSTI